MQTIETRAPAMKSNSRADRKFSKVREAAMKLNDSEVRQKREDQEEHSWRELTVIAGE
jgi:hypothetical protein